MKAQLILVAILSAAVFGFGAQRPRAQEQRPPAKASADISGMYSFLHEGEFVQLTVEEQGRVTGFVSRYGDLESDRGIFLDQFFTKGALEGSSLWFQTRPIHGVWFEFHGQVTRGDGKTPNDEAYRVIKGTLTEYSSNENKKTSARMREVTLKSFPQDAGQEPARKE